MDCLHGIKEAKDCVNTPVSSDGCYPVMLWEVCRIKLLKLLSSENTIMLKIRLLVLVIMQVPQHGGEIILPAFEVTAIEFNNVSEEMLLSSTTLEESVSTTFAV